MKPSEMNEQEWQESISSIRKIVEKHENPRLKELKNILLCLLTLLKKWLKGFWKNRLMMRKTNFR